MKILKKLVSEWSQHSRRGSFVAKNAVLNAMLCKYWSVHRRRYHDGYFSRAGSCCQIGKNCHISAGWSWRVLEPAQALPTIIEDNVF